LLDLLLSQLGERSGSNNDWLLGKVTLTKDLEDTSLLTVDNRNIGGLSVSDSSLLGNEGPNLLNVHSWAVISVASKMEVSHTDLSEITRVVLVEVDSVMMLTTSLTTTSGVLTVLADTTMTHADMTSEASSLLQT
jgi:hypothetical protein